MLANKKFPKHCSEGSKLMEIWIEGPHILKAKVT